MTEQKHIVLMAPASLHNSGRKTSALQSSALAQLSSDGDLIDLHDIGKPESWSHWWRDMLATGEVTLVLILDGCMIGFRQQQRAERAAKMGAPVYILWQPDGPGHRPATWTLTPIRDVHIRPMKPRPGHRLSLAQFAYITERS